MKTIAMGLAALLMSTSVYAQSAATGGSERGGMRAGAEQSGGQTRDVGRRARRHGHQGQRGALGWKRHGR
ncbi:hypothetical protein M2437_002818 [Methylorubrum pseudosasae]|nr:hypothetical protein [Methylorubrum pseudosasae]